MRMMIRYLVAIRPVDMSTGGQMLTENALGALLMLACALFSGELSEAHEAITEHGTPARYAIVVGGCIVAFLICFSGLKLGQLVTATAFVVMTNATKTIVLLSGIFLFADRYSALGAIGAVVSLLASAMFSRLQSLETSLSSGTETGDGETASDVNAHDIGDSEAPRSEVEVTGTAEERRGLLSSK